MTPVAGPQLVVLYNDDRELAHVYDTAYSEKQAVQVTAHCVARYGGKAQVRSVPAKQFPPRAS